MTDTPRKPPRGVALSLTASVIAILVCIVYSITGQAAWPTIVVALLAFASAYLLTQRLRREGTMHPLASVSFGLGVIALVWSIVLLIVGA